MLPPDPDFGLLDPLGGCAVGVGAGAGVFCGLEAGGLMGVGGGDAGVVTVVTGVVTATAEVLGAACEVELVVAAPIGDVERAGADTATTGTASGGELARRTGIAGPVKAVETLAGSCSRGAFAGRSDLPIAKKHANTATQSSIATTIVRAYVASVPRRASNDGEMRTLFMTDTPWGWFPKG